MGKLRYLSSEDVRALMPPCAEVVTLVEDALRLAGEGKVTAPARLDLPAGEEGCFHAMPAQVGEACGVKWVGGFPKNLAKGLPSIQGLVLLSDPQTGQPLAALDGSVITAARTGACAAVAARHLADPASEVLTIIGCGVQGWANVEALLGVFPRTERILCYDLDVQRQADFADRVMETHSVATIVPPEPQEAVEGAHILVTSIPETTPPQPVIEPGWLQPGTLAVAQDADASFQPAVFGAVQRLVTDSSEQFAAKRAEGRLEGVPEPDAELPAIVAGKAPGRGEGQPTVLAVHLGLGLLDVALAAALLKRAEAEQCGALLET